jgi:N-acetylglucosaminyl-diphospho-decaprenol L-rhamnosyltransferase
MSPPLSFVVVTWNSGKELPRLLASLASHLRTDYEVIVVDNGSSDASVAICKAAKEVVRLVECPDNPGFGAANNLGVSYARNDAVVLLNPDTYILDDSIRRTAERAIALQALVGPRILNPDLSEQPSASPLWGTMAAMVGALLPHSVLPRPVRSRAFPWTGEQEMDAGWLTGACITGPRTLLRELGPFDPSIHLYSEDLDLGFRAAAAGVPVVFSPSSGRIVHSGDASSSQRLPDAGVSASVVNGYAALGRNAPRRVVACDFVLRIAGLLVRYVAKLAARRPCAAEASWIRALLANAGVVFGGAR